MATHPDHNSVDGDDEREEDSEEDSEDEEVSETEEEEPRLKYQRLSGSLPSILSTDAASSIAIAERMIALGTHDGFVYILDFQGNQVKEFAAHTATVNALSFDVEGEYIGSCSDDGTVAINSLFTDETLKFEYHRPMKTLALDPEYSRKSSKRHVTGGLAGHLYLNSKSWIGYSKQELHAGEGPIHAVKWRTSLIAWANDAGVKVYDMTNNARIAFIERPRGSPRPELLLPHIIWQDDTQLVIGWGTYVKIAAIMTSPPRRPNGVEKNAQTSNTKYVDIVASFQTTYYISGLAPFGDALVILAYIPVAENAQKDFDNTVPSRQGTAQRPEIRIVSRKNEELTTDALPMLGFEHYKAKDYALAHAPFSGSSYAGGQWAEGDEPLYYIISPKDVVIARPRDAEDHISWLLQHGCHEKALAAAEAGQGKTELLDKVGSRYLDHLIVERKYAEAASLCPKLLRGSAPAWERWVLSFANLRQLPVLVPYMPTENPRLSNTFYEDDTQLVIGWGTYVKIAAIMVSPPRRPNGVEKNAQTSNTKYVDIVASFQTTYYISGLAPFGDALVILAYIPVAENAQKDFDNTVPSRQIALVGLATNPSYHEILLKIIKCWPQTLYSALPVISAIETQIHTSSMTDMLKETLAELYIIDNQYEKALVLFAEVITHPWCIQMATCCGILTI